VNRARGDRKWESNDSYSGEPQTGGLTPDLISQPPFRGGSREFISSD